MSPMIEVARSRIGTRQGDEIVPWSLFNPCKNFASVLRMMNGGIDSRQTRTNSLSVFTVFVIFCYFALPSSSLLREIHKSIL